ncbi:MAG TPA: SDR family oxidoreductase [Spirochaetia bacterium]|nr:SDR family oxidoreductase [Spirochaetales bacterium]HRY79553.1 SDR family oxidoreductase [Spirochaetia bacterium]HRZ88862.1 SDR family oxidoreductase [Spirochaetia bacterium]
MEIKGSVAVVTGGASGIGEAVAKTLAAKGASVVIGDMNQAGIDRVVAEIKKAGGKAAGKTLNVTDDADTAAFMDFAVKEFGAINVVVPCAGIIKDGLMISPDKETGKVKRVLSTADFRAVIDVNLVGPFITIREAASRMVDNGWKGVLITISSIQKQGGVGQINYSSTKAAMALWPKILVGEFQMKGITGIRVASIAPGYVGTPMVKGMDQGALAKILSGVHLGRLIEPEEIAETIAFIVSNDAVNATCIEVAGGMISGLIAK